MASIATTLPAPFRASLIKSIQLKSGARLEADAFVFALGPWLPKLFPDLLDGRIVPTRQEVFFFAPPAGDPRFLPGAAGRWG